MSAKMVEKIAKLIAKAENAAATPEEAAAFMAKAEELMLKHAIDRARLQNPAQPRPQVVRVCLEYSDTGLPKSYWPVLRDGAFNVCAATGLVGSAVVNAAMDFYVYGVEADAQSVSHMLASMWGLAGDYLRAWRRTDWYYNSLSWDVPEEYNEKWACTIGFLKGFGLGFARAIQDAKRATLDTTPGAELVLVGNLERVAEAMADADVRPGRWRPLKVGHGGLEEGYRSGYEAQRQTTPRLGY